MLQAGHPKELPANIELPQAWTILNKETKSRLQEQVLKGQVERALARCVSISGKPNYGFVYGTLCEGRHLPQAELRSSQTTTGFGSPASVLVLTKW